MKYTVRTTLGELIADPQAKAVLERFRPGATSHPQLHQGLHMTLQELVSYPEANLSQGQLEELLRQLDRELGNSQG